MTTMQLDPPHAAVKTQNTNMSARALRKQRAFGASTFRCDPPAGGERRPCVYEVRMQCQKK